MKIHVLILAIFKDVKWPRASISQDYWGDIKEDWGSGERKSPTGSGAELFCETTHNICSKIQQTTVVAVTG